MTLMGEYDGFTESIKKSGNYVAGEALQPVAAASTVWVRDGKPAAQTGAVEVRPCIDFSQQG